MLWAPLCNAKPRAIPPAPTSSSSASPPTASPPAPAPAATSPPAATTPAPGAAPSPPGPLAAPAPPISVAARTTVDFRPSRPAALQRRVRLADEWRWETLCQDACRVQIDPALSYRVSGEDVMESDPFALGGSQVTVDATVGSRRSLILGLVAGGGGATLLLTGLPLVLLANADLRDARNQPIDDNARTTLKHVGYGLSITGVVGLVVGLSLFLPNLSTDVRTTRSNTDASAPGGPRFSLGRGLYLTPAGLTF